MHIACCIRLGSTQFPTGDDFFPTTETQSVTVRVWLHSLAEVTPSVTCFCLYFYQTRYSSNFLLLLLRTFSYSASISCPSRLDLSYLVFRLHLSPFLFSHTPLPTRRTRKPSSKKLPQPPTPHTYYLRRLPPFQSNPSSSPPPIFHHNNTLFSLHCIALLIHYQLLAALSIRSPIHPHLHPRTRTDRNVLRTP